VSKGFQRCTNWHALFQEGYDDEDEEYDEEEDEDDDPASPCEDSADLDNAENQQKVSSSSIRAPGQSRRNSLRVEFDGLSIVDEETETVSNDLTPVEQCADAKEGASTPFASRQFNVTRQANMVFGSVKSQDGEKYAMISNNGQVNGACFSTLHGRDRHEQQFFGKIKLPNGKEGVFMSDAMLPNSDISNGLQIYGGDDLKGNSYGCGTAIEFGQSDYHILNENLWSDIPTLLPAAPQNVVGNRSAILPSSQGHYNYAFTPVDSTLLPNGTSAQDNYAFEKPNNFPGIPQNKTMSDNDACRETRSVNVYSERGENTELQECGLNDDTYFGMGENIQDTATANDDIMPGYYRRGGPDLFITGAYPLTTSPASFPVGGNLDQLLRQMDKKESESVTSVPVMESTGSGTAVAKCEIEREEAPAKDSTENVS
jgi:hypothetical protein